MQQARFALARKKGAAPVGAALVVYLSMAQAMASTEAMVTPFSA